MQEVQEKKREIQTLHDLAKLSDYSLVNTLFADPQSREDGEDYNPREVFNGHYVPVKPTPIENPKYIAHSKIFFEELGFSDTLAQDTGFMKMFSADTTDIPDTMRQVGWACGYALSIFGTEYYQQCPFQTGNGYGDGRAISILELLVGSKRWEMQLKGGGRTPYCRGADGRAVLRSSIREFLAQEHMHALGISTSRSLTLYTSETETVKRPWFTNGSYSRDPEVMIEEAVAISTRVAPSFLRVGQLELFGRRARKNEHPNALKELEQIVLHVIDREYANEIDQGLALEQKILLLASEFRSRLTSLVANWIRVGYCQGNFNSDNCAVGGFTLDYGPFGFIDMFDPRYQPWTGGGIHFSFFNQTKAAERNFQMFCSALKPLLQNNADELEKLEMIENEFSDLMQMEMQKMWASKLGLARFDVDLFNDLMRLMIETSVDYTLFFRELSSIPEDISPLRKSFYNDEFIQNTRLDLWSDWLHRWRELLKSNNTDDLNASSPDSCERLSKQMKQINPKYTLREWFLVPAYSEATQGNYTLVKELQVIMTDPFSEQSQEIEDKYYQKKPNEFFKIAGISHVSCSS